MSLPSVLLLIAYLTVLLALAWPMGRWLVAVAEGRFHPKFATLGRIESGLFRLAGVQPREGMSWQRYALALMLFNAIGIAFVFALQMVQAQLPLNPQAMGNLTWHSSLNTAVSFVTNTNWQGYAGETTMGYLTQMLALAVQNFLSAATGIAVAFALIRGFALRSADSIGNFWADVTRITLWLLLPLCFVFALVLVGQGVIQNFDAYLTLQPLDAGTHEQTIAMGPVASQEAIKMLGTNGGGFFNANSAHPFENPTVFSNFLQMLSIFVIPAGLCFAFGRMVGDRRQGWAILAAMTIIFVAMTMIVMWAEQQPHPAFAALGIDQQGSALQAGGNMEGKEVRFGIAASTLFVSITTAASCGAVNAMHDSLMPLGGLVPMWLMQLGEVVFGGTGSGLYGMLVYAILAVFIAGLMIGRTPEYLGKKIEAREMQMASIAILVTPFLVLVGVAVAVMVEPGRVGVANPGAHGFSEILYAFSSAANNNGSAFAGLSANTPFYNLALAAAMFFGRFGVILPVLAIAGSLAAKKRLDSGAGTLPTHGALFVGLLIGTVILVGALTYVPALALGPVIDHLLLVSPAIPQP